MIITFFIKKKKKKKKKKNFLNFFNLFTYLFYYLPSISLSGDSGGGCLSQERS